MTNAFSSVPILLLIALVEMLGVPPNFCRMLEVSLKKSRVLKKGDESEGWFYQISGVKQGFLSSPRFFVLVIGVVLQKLMQKVEAMVAFVDDVACVVESQEDVARILVFVQDEMQKLGLTLNWDKTVVQTFGAKHKFSTAVFTQKGHGEGFFCSFEHNDGLRLVRVPPKVDGGLRLVEMVDQFWHVGHPITASGLAGEAYDMACRKFMDFLNHFNSQHLPVRARIQSVNIVLLPKLLYMLE